VSGDKLIIEMENPYRSFTTSGSELDEIR